MIVMGRVVAPFGVKGWIRINPFGDDPLSWAEMSEWWISADSEAPQDQWKSVKVLSCQEHGGSLIAQVAEVPDRTAAEALKGWYVAAPRDSLPAPKEDEYYWADLIGLTVENLTGESFGKVAGLLSTGAHDVLQVADGDTERLIPFVAAYAVEVDIAAGLIRVDWQKDW